MGTVNYVPVYAKGEKVTFALNRDSESINGKIMSIDPQLVNGRTVDKISVIGDDSQLYVLESDQLEDTERVEII
jgi:hypothetical protein